MTPTAENLAGPYADLHNVSPRSIKRDLAAIRKLWR